MVDNSTNHTPGEIPSEITVYVFQNIDSNSFMAISSDVRGIMARADSYAQVRKNFIETAHEMYGITEDQITFDPTIKKTL